MEQRFENAIDDAYHQGGFDGLFRWFSIDGTQSLEEAIKWGFADFAITILRPPVPDLLIQPYNKVALEIGFGGGRLLRPACQVFQYVYGLDVHSMGPVVEQYLRAAGLANFGLLRSDGRSIPMDANSVDFIYSHIVFIHLSEPQVLESYIREIWRVLKPGGVASLYYGRPYSDRTRSAKSAVIAALLHFLEPFIEFVALDLRNNGYRTRPEVRANSISLMVTRRRMRTLARASGFSKILLRTSRNWQQGHLILQK